jgi:subtilisin family serine protease
VLTVGAVDRSLQPASFSSSGPGLDLVAPGVAIPFAHPTDPEQSVRLDGTSFSAPIVSAAAAWLKTARPTLAAGQVMDVLRHSADDIGAPGWDFRSGWGLLNVPNALVGPTPPVDPLEPNDDVEQVNGGVGPAQRSIDGPRGGNVRIAASVDAGEDPHDVYRVVVPAKRRLVVTVAGNANLRAALWTVNAFTVRVGRDGRLAFSNRPGTRSEQVAWTNARKTAAAIFLDVSPAGAGIRGRYTAWVRIVRAPR